MSNTVKHLSRFVLIGFIALLYSCEPFYDPVRYGDVSDSQGSAWEGGTINVKKTVVNPYTEADLSQTMSLSLLLDMALYNNPSTRVSWNAARASAYSYRASLSNYYPTLTYTGNLSAQTVKGPSFASSGNAIISGTTTTTTQTHTTYVFNDLNLTYILLDFGGRSATSELAYQTLVASNWQHNYTMQQVMLSVLTAYTSYLGNKGLVEAYKQDLKDAEVALQASLVMKRAGLATLTDVLLSQSNLETTRTNLVQAEGSEKTSIGELLIAVGLPADTNITLEDLPKDLPVIEVSGNISSLLELAKTQRPDLGVAIAAIKEQEAQLALSYSNSMPILSSQLFWDQFRPISPRNHSSYTEVASFNLNFPIFQGFFYMNQQRQLQAQVEEALANLDVQVANVSTQVVSAYYAYQSAESALPSALAAVEYSQRAFRGFVAQYKTGTASILDVLTALTALSNARAQLVVIRTQWAQSLANLAFAVGILDDTSGVFKKSPPGQLSELPINDDKKETKDE